MAGIIKKNAPVVDLSAWIERDFYQLKYVAHQGEVRRLSQNPEIAATNWANVTRSTFWGLFLKEYEKKLGKRNFYIGYTLRQNNTVNFAVFLDTIDVRLLGHTGVMRGGNEFPIMRSNLEAFVSKVITERGLIPPGLLELAACQEFFEPIALVSLLWCERLYEKLKEDRFSCLNQGPVLDDHENADLVKELLDHMTTFSEQLWSGKLCLRIRATDAHIARMLGFRYVAVIDQTFDEIYKNSCFNAEGVLNFDETLLPDDCPQRTIRSCHQGKSSESNSFETNSSSEQFAFTRSAEKHMLFTSVAGKIAVRKVRDYVERRHKAKDEMAENFVKICEKPSTSGESMALRLAPQRIETFVEKVTHSMAWKLVEYKSRDPANGRHTCKVWLSRFPYAFLGGEASGVDEGETRRRAVVMLYVQMGKVAILPENLLFLIPLDDRWCDVAIDHVSKGLKQMTLALDLPKVKVKMRQLVNDEAMSGKPVENGGELDKMIALMMEETHRISKMLWSRLTILAPLGAQIPSGVGGYPSIERDTNDVFWDQEVRKNAWTDKGPSAPSISSLQALLFNKQEETVKEENTGEWQSQPQSSVASSAPTPGVQRPPSFVSLNTSVPPPPLPLYMSMPPPIPVSMCSVPMSFSVPPPQIVALQAPQSLMALPLLRERPPGVELPFVPSSTITPTTTFNNLLLSPSEIERIIVHKRVTENRSSPGLYSPRSTVDGSVDGHRISPHGRRERSSSRDRRSRSTSRGRRRRSTSRDRRRRSISRDRKRRHHTSSRVRSRRSPSPHIGRLRSPSRDRKSRDASPGRLRRSCSRERRLSSTSSRDHRHRDSPRGHRRRSSSRDRHDRKSSAESRRKVSGDRSTRGSHDRSDKDKKEDRPSSRRHRSTSKDGQRSSATSASALFSVESTDANDDSSSTASACPNESEIDSFIRDIPLEQADFVFNPADTMNLNSGASTASFAKNSERISPPLRTSRDLEVGPGCGGTSPPRKVRLVVQSQTGPPGAGISDPAIDPSTLLSNRIHGMSQNLGPWGSQA